MAHVYPKNFSPPNSIRFFRFREIFLRHISRYVENVEINLSID